MQGPLDAAGQSIGHGRVRPPGFSGCGRTRVHSGTSVGTQARENLGAPVGRQDQPTEPGQVGPSQAGLGWGEPDWIGLGRAGLGRVAASRLGSGGLRAKQWPGPRKVG
ncbi:hypothetical protein GCM10010452_32030 [Crossiella cryophila]